MGGSGGSDAVHESRKNATNFTVEHLHLYWSFGCRRAAVKGQGVFLLFLAILTQPAFYLSWREFRRAQPENPRGPPTFDDNALNSLPLIHVLAERLFECISNPLSDKGARRRTLSVGDAVDSFELGVGKTDGEPPTKPAFGPDSLSGH